MVKTQGALTGGALGAGVGEMVATMILPGADRQSLSVWRAARSWAPSVARKSDGQPKTQSLPALPEEELFVYEDALRRGRTVVIVL